MNCIVACGNFGEDVILSELMFRMMIDDKTDSKSD